MPGAAREVHRRSAQRVRPARQPSRRTPQRARRTTPGERIQKKAHPAPQGPEHSEPAGDRTQDLRIKSPLLYQLSYRLKAPKLEPPRDFQNPSGPRACSRKEIRPPDGQMEREGTGADRMDPMARMGREWGGGAGRGTRLFRTAKRGGSGGGGHRSLFISRPSAGRRGPDSSRYSGRIHPSTCHSGLRAESLSVSGKDSSFESLASLEDRILLGIHELPGGPFPSRHPSCPEPLPRHSLLASPPTPRRSLT